MGSQNRGTQANSCLAVRSTALHSARTAIPLLLQVDWKYDCGIPVQAHSSTHSLEYAGGQRCVQPNGKTLATISSDKTVYLWDLGTGTRAVHRTYRLDLKHVQSKW